jgi:hypothetical protein
MRAGEAFRRGVVFLVCTAIAPMAATLRGYLKIFDKRGAPVTWTL